MFSSVSCSHVRSADDCKAFHKLLHFLFFSVFSFAILFCFDTVFNGPCLTSVCSVFGNLKHYICTFIQKYICVCFNKEQLFLLLFMGKKT